MKKQFLLLALFVSVSFISFSQEMLKERKDLSICYSKNEVKGVLIFLDSKPYYDYVVISTEKVKVNWGGDPMEDLGKELKKLKKKHPLLEGMIFSLSSKHIAELIMFKEH